MAAWNSPANIQEADAAADKTALRNPRIAEDKIILLSLDKVLNPIYGFSDA
ncbi:MAG: hypothetical protein HFE76_09515 [Firmicutes bacterium]|nr:hypothetical protein [Bacillota bacterium]